MKNIVIVGTRPNLVKLPSFFKLYQKAQVVWIGQHWDKELTEYIFRDLDIPMPDEYHELGYDSKSQGDFIAKAIRTTEEVIKRLKPDCVYVVGDCNVTLGAAIATKKCGVKLGHIEAGCRAKGIVQEEHNRRCVDQLADVLLAPDIHCYENLVKEGVRGNLHLTPNFQAETLRMSNILTKPANRHIVFTLHRRENIENIGNLRNILNAIVLNFAYSGYKVYFPVHPHTRKIMEENELWLDFTRHEFLELVKPIPYKEFLELVSNSAGVITDSGGLQVEADLLMKPCVTIREDTEWKYTLYNKNKLVSTKAKSLSQGMQYLLGGDK